MDRASYEAGFRAAQEQNLQQPPEQGNQFLDAVGKTALGLGIAAGAGIAGRRLMRGRGFGAETAETSQKPTRRQEVEQNARIAASELQKRTGSLQTGVKLPLASEVVQGVPTAEQRRAAYAASAAKPEADLPEVTRPTSGADVELIRETTGELRPAGQSPKDYDDAADRFLRKYEGEYTQAKQRQEAAEIGRESQRQTKEVAQDILAELKEEAEGNFANEYLVQKQYVDANASQQLLEEGAVTSVQKQQMVEGQVSNQSAEAIDTGADQEAMRVSRTVQRDPNENLAEFERVQDGLEQRGASPVEAADAAVVVTEGEIPFTQTDVPVQGPISAQETADAALAEMKARRAEVAATGLQPGTTRYERALAQSFRTSANVKPQMTGESMAKTALPAGPIRQTVQSAGAVDFETLPERTVSNIGPEAVVTKTAQGTAIRGASPVLEQAPSVSRQRQIFGTAEANVPGAPDEYMPDRPARETALSQIETQPQERIDPYAVRQQEGGGPAGIGVYGVEPSYVPGAQSKSTGLMSVASERKPTDVRQSALDKVRNPYSNLSDQELGQISMTGTASEAYNASKQLTKRRSIDASREIQQLQKSGRPDAQQLVQQYIQDLKQG